VGPGLKTNAAAPFKDLKVSFVAQEISSHKLLTDRARELIEPFKRCRKSSSFDFKKSGQF